MKQYFRKAVFGMIFVVLLTICAAAADTGLTVVSPETIPAVGETFTVQVKITGNPGLSSVQYTLSYDKSVVECQKVKLGSILSESVSAKNPNADTGAIIACAATDEMTGDGVMSEYTFKVLQSGEPDFGLSVDRLKDADGKSVELGNKAPSTDSDETGKNDAPNANKQQFSDVPKQFWASEYIGKAVEQKLMTGSLDGTFRPNQELTRGEFISWLYNLSGKTPVEETAAYEDVPVDAPCRDAVNWAAAKGYALGDGIRFKPNDKLTREQMITILYRYYGGLDSIGTMTVGFYDPLNRFTDSNAVSPWAADAVRWAVYTGIIKGTSDTTLNPKGIVTRAQLATAFVRCAEKLQ